MGNLDFFFIVNSRIGARKIKELQNAIKIHLSKYQLDIHYTVHAGHAKKLSHQAVRQNAKIVIAVGGDGTINEVIQELALSSSILAIIPTGSGNGLARHLKIPLQIDQAVQTLTQYETKNIDLGYINGIYFISNAGVGFDAMVCNAIKASRFRGLKMYVWEVMKHYFKFKPSTYQILADDVKLHQKAFFLNIANGSEFGYGFQIAPNANLEDGLLDLVLIKKINIFNSFSIVWDGFNKRIQQNKHCIHLRASRIDINADRIPYFQTDGDAHNCSNEHCTIEVKPKSLKILAPKNQLTNE